MSGGSREVEPGVSQYRIHGDALTIAIHDAQIVLGVCRSLCSGFFPPRRCRDGIFSDKTALSINYTEIVLRPRVPLCRSRTIPMQSFHHIYLHAIAQSVGQAKIVLRVCTPLRGSLLPPLNSLGHILSPPFTMRKNHSQFVLRLRITSISLLGQRRQFNRQRRALNRPHRRGRGPPFSTTADERNGYKKNQCTTKPGNPALLLNEPQHDDSLCFQSIARLASASPT